MFFFANCPAQNVKKFNIDHYENNILESLLNMPLWKQTDALTHVNNLEHYSVYPGAWQCSAI